MAQEERWRVNNDPKLGESKIFIESHPEGRTIKFYVKWNGTEWIIDENQDGVGSSTDIVNSRFDNMD